MATEEDIYALLESQDCVNSKFLSYSHSLSIEEARHTLESFSNNNKSIELTKVYIVSGFRKADHIYKFAYCDGNNVEDVKKRFEADTLSQTLYGISKKCSDPQYSLISNRAIEESLTIVQSMSELNISNLFHGSGIQFPSIQVLPPGRKLDRTPSLQSNDIKSSHLQSANFPPKPLNQSSSMSKSSAAVTDFFNRSAAASPTTAPVSHQSLAAKTTAIIAPTTAFESSTVPSSEEVIEEDETWDDGTGTAHRPNKEALKEREHHAKSIQKKRFIIEDDDEEEDVVEIDKGQNESKLTTTSVKKPKNAQSKKKNVKSETIDSAEADDVLASTTVTSIKKDNKKVNLQHGAMDDYFEDVAIAAEKERQTLPNENELDSSHSNSVTNTTKRRLVEKTFADAKGYLVSAMVWEEFEVPLGDAAPDTIHVSGAESKENKKMHEANVKESNTDNEKKNSSKSKSAKKVPPANQKSMMSFFGTKS